MRNIKTLVVAAGAAAVLGGVGIGVAQASSSGPASTVAPSTSSTSSTPSSHESEARGRVAEGETHARHTGTDDRTASPTAIPSSSPTVDDHGSGGHGADG